MFDIDGHHAMPAWPGGPACRAGMARHRASTGHRAGRAVPRPCSCLVNGPWHGPWAVLPCRAAWWARPFSPGRAGPWPMMHTSQFHTSQITVHSSHFTESKFHSSHNHTSFTESKFTLLSQFTVHSSHFTVSQKREKTDTAHR